MSLIQKHFPSTKRKRERGAGSKRKRKPPSPDLSPARVSLPSSLSPSSAPRAPVSASAPLLLWQSQRGPVSEQARLAVPMLRVQGTQAPGPVSQERNWGGGASGCPHCRGDTGTHRAGDLSSAAKLLKDQTAALRDGVVSSFSSTATCGSQRHPQMGEPKILVPALRALGGSQPGGLTALAAWATTGLRKASLERGTSWHCRYGLLSGRC